METFILTGPRLTLNTPIINAVQIDEYRESTLTLTHFVELFILFILDKGSSFFLVTLNYLRNKI